jgi:uncharacterized protein
MAQAAKSQEPSMEEILASIRRIIAEDDSEKSAPHPAEAAGVELNPDAAASSLGAARAMGDSYSPPLPDSPAPSIGALSGTARAAPPSTVLDLIEPMRRPRPNLPRPPSIQVRRRRRPGRLSMPLPMRRCRALKAAVHTTMGVAD